MKIITFLHPAEQEMIEAARYYDAQARGLGRKFLLEIQRVTDDIAQKPAASPILENEIRRRLIRRFPNGILYRVEQDQILIIAIINLHRKPG